MPKSTKSHHGSQLLTDAIQLRSKSAVCQSYFRLSS